MLELYLPNQIEAVVEEIDLEDIDLGGNMANQEARMKMYQSALRSIPKFSGTKGERWTFHVHALRIWSSANAMEDIATEEQRKLAILSSLSGPAMRAVELHGPGKPSFVGAQTAAEFIQLITTVFMPQAESNLARMDFESYKQSADEPISAYGTTKLSLYHQSEPNVAARSFAYLRNQMLSGIYSGHVKAEVIRMDPQTEEDLLNQMTTCVGRAREAYQLGCGIVSNLDGLASTTRLTSGWNQGQGGQEPMEIDGINKMDKKCYKCQKPGHFAKECRVKPKLDGKNAGGSQGSGGNKKSSKDMTCFYCQKKGHKASECFKKKRDAKNQSSNQGNKPKGVKKTQEAEDEWTAEEETVGKMDFPWMGVRSVSSL